MGKGLELSGKVFNRLTVLKQVVLPNQQQRNWLCRCKCGVEKVIGAKEITKGRTKSCGCLWRESAAKTCIERNTTHGGSKTLLYGVWVSMLNRCRNPNVEAYPRYGGRGIKVCKRWLKFENFKKDMGNPGEGLTLERVNTNGNYEKSNCIWTTYKEQNSNRRNNVYVFVGEDRITVSECSRRLGIPHQTLGYRVSHGIPTPGVIYA